MKKTAFLIPVTALAMAACTHKDPPPPSGNTTVIVPDDECPRKDGQPCK